MTDTSSPEFYPAFQLRQACCQALLELSQRQSELITEENYTEMLEILQSKQSLLDHLGRLSRDQQPLRDAWSTQRETLSAEDRLRCDAVLSRTQALLAQVLAAEQSSTRQLLARRHVTQRALQSLSAGVQAQMAYQSRPPAVLSRLDLDT